jgi:hypothetical protein
MKFHRGDRVVAYPTARNLRCFRGHAGRVVKVDADDQTPYLVKFDQKVRELCMDWTDTWFKEDELIRERTN